MSKRNMAIAAARPHAFVVAAMLRVLEKRVVDLQRHGVTGRAKRVGARVAFTAALKMIE